MATTKFYLDCRAVKDGQKAPLKLCISKNGRTALISLDVYVTKEQWDRKSGKVINHENKNKINNYINRRKLEIETLILSLYDNEDCVRMSAQQIKDHIIKKLKPTVVVDNLFSSIFLRFAESKTESTKRVYLYTYSRLKAYAGDKLEKLHFEDITKEWLTSFDNFLARTANKNSRNISLRNIRSVFNEAIDNGVTSFYPFRRFPITPAQTPKRSLSIIQLATLFNTHSNLEYLDMFKIIFYLIGINVIDLYNLKTIKDGRIEYYRAKTNRFYSIKIEPEAFRLIEKHRGKKYLLDIKERYSDHRNYIHRMNNALQKIGPYTTNGRGGKRNYNPLFPNITTYWARHTWATIASELDIPNDTIAAALGHSMGNPTTAIYIDFNIRKVDDANRTVIDCINQAQFALYLCDLITKTTAILAHHGGFT